MRIRVWSEFLSCEEASDPRVLDLLQEHDVGINFSVKHEMVAPALAELLRETTTRGISMCLWLLLSKAEGYWPSERNAERFAEYVEEVLGWAGKEGVVIDEIAVDLEPPLYFHEETKDLKGIRAAFAGLRIARSNLNRHRFRHAAAVFNKMQDSLAERGIETYVPVLPLIVDDMVRGSEVIQDLAEGPVSSVGWDRISPMIYTTMFQQFSNRFISREDARWMVYSYSKDLVEQVNDRAAASIGLTGTGILGKEWIFRDIDELRQDAAAAKAAGVEDIAIFNLEGIMNREDPDAWLRAVIDAEPEVPVSSRRAERLRWAIQRGSRLLGVFR
ncbi:MAG: hypothetical protein ACE5FL_02755 [Myxococcota bacterium]